MSEKLENKNIETPEEEKTEKKSSRIKATKERISNMTLGQCAKGILKGSLMAAGGVGLFVLGQHTAGRNEVAASEEDYEEDYSSDEE